MTKQNVRLSLDGSIHDPTARVGRLLFHELAMVTELESESIRVRTRKGVRVAEANGRRRASSRSPPRKGCPSGT